MTCNLTQKLRKPLKNLADKCACIVDIQVETPRINFEESNLMHFKVMGNTATEKPHAVDLFVYTPAKNVESSESSYITELAAGIKHGIRSLDNSGIFAPKRSKVLAVDFDGCLCKNAWPNIGEPNKRVIEAVKQRQRDGWKVILWTCREDDVLLDALKWCSKQGLCFDAVNENLPERIKEYGRDPRKIGADEYWDDLAVTMHEDVFTRTSEEVKSCRP